LDPGPNTFAFATVDSNPSSQLTVTGAPAWN
jgi:hypothetical protein